MIGAGVSWKSEFGSKIRAKWGFKLMNYRDQSFANASASWIDSDGKGRHNGKELVNINVVKEKYWIFFIAKE